MALPKEVQECLEKMLEHLTLKEACLIMGHLGNKNFMESLEVELGQYIQRASIEEDWENTEWMSSDGLTSEEVAIDNENYLLDLEGK